MDKVFREGQEITLTISHLGGMGEGVANVGGHPIFVPLTLPGDKVRAVMGSVSKDYSRATLQEVLEPGPERQSAPCIHFGECGGCTLQHLSPALYSEFKQSILIQVVKRLGYDERVVRPLIEVGAGARRRVEFSVQVQKGEVILGFLARRSHALVNVHMCPVTQPEIVALLPALSGCIAALKKPALVKSVSVTQLAKGMDVLFSTQGKLAPADHKAMRAFFAAHANVLRIAVREGEGEAQMIEMREESEVIFGTTHMNLPPGAFLQAAAISQKAITELVAKHAQGAKRVVDIYSGCGTYSFPLAEAGHAVSAFEGDAEMVAAMHNAARRLKGEGRLTATVRDLFKKPLKAAELKAFDAVVINPPRNGAGPQTKEIAASGVGRVIMVSCNPATFERDAAYLKGAGYTLLEATPIDQFTWSHHLELVALFETTN